MLGTARLPLSDLIELCHALHLKLSIGMSMVDVFEQQATAGSPRLKKIVGSVALALRKGQSVEQAFLPHRQAFPDLFLTMIQVGEESGSLPEIFDSLEKHYSLQRSLRRQFMGRIAWPLVQYVFAIFVLSFVMIILDFLGSDVDPLGLGLRGVTGAVTLVTIGLGALIAIVLIVRMMLNHRTLGNRLLKIPVVGAAIESMALQRFCLAMQLLLETSVAIDKSVKMSLSATEMASYASRGEIIAKELKKGKELRRVLAKHSNFPEDFIRAVGVGEESGRLPDVMKRQAKHYEQESTRRLKQLTSTLAMVVWLFVAGLIVFAIFRLASVYFDALNQVG